MIITPNLATPEGLLSELLAGTVEDLDIPAELDRHARWRYHDIGRFLNRHGDAKGDAEWNVYPQGSFLLGTVVSPASLQGHYDIDLVCLRMIEKTSTSQLELRKEVGDALSAYAAGAGALVLGEGGRCWTLTEATLRFHSDVLPAIPDRDGSVTGILLTDRDLFRWLKSDPIRYAEWFKEQMKEEFMAKMLELAELRRSRVDDIPESDVKTTLQRSVQVLKRHRDIHFQHTPKNAPPSILITTLAAHSYKGEQNLFEAVVQMADTMPRHIRRDAYGWSVPNPVQPAENFADKWKAEPGRERAFTSWIEALRRDLDEMSKLRGLGSVSDRMVKSFGEVVRKSAERVGGKYLSAREAGGLYMASSGVLSATTADSLKVRKHSFYGAADHAK